MPLSKGVTIVFGSLGTSKKWTGNTSITFFIAQNTHTHTSNDMYQKNFKENQQLFWWLLDWLVSCVELQEFKFGGFSHLKFQNFPGRTPGPPFHFAVPMQNTFRRPCVGKPGIGKCLGGAFTKAFESLVKSVQGLTAQLQAERSEAKDREVRLNVQLRAPG